jgi:hypothetical protein
MILMSFFSDCVFIALGGFSSGLFAWTRVHRPEGGDLRGIVVIVPRERFVSFSLFLCLTLSGCFFHGLFRCFLPSDVGRFVAVLWSARVRPVACTASCWAENARLDGLRCPALGVLYENGGVFSASVEPVGYLILGVCKDLRVAASPYGL